MAWKKGAVVIVKRGDPEWADALEQSLEIKRASDREVEELENENKDLKRSNNLSKIHDTKFTNAMIEKLERDYGQRWVPPKWARHIMEGFALIIYWISLFVDKYLVLK